MKRCHLGINPGVNLEKTNKNLDWEEEHSDLGVKRFHLGEDLRVKRRDLGKTLMGMMEESVRDLKDVDMKIECNSDVRMRVCFG